MDHDPTKQIGVIDSIRLDQSQRKLRASARFGNSALAKEAYEDVVDRIRTNVSIGYHVNAYSQEEPESWSEQPVFRGIVLDYREKQSTASAVTTLEDTGM